MELKEVEAIWSRAYETMKPYFGRGEYAPKPSKDGSLEWPEFWSGYRKAVAAREALLPHIESGYYAEALFRTRAPNQTDAEAAYIKSNYRQITLPVSGDYLNTILRATNDSNYRIDWSPGKEGDDGDKEFREYVHTGIPEYRSLFNFWRYVVPKIKTTDAMGVIAVLPDTLPTIETEQGPVVDPEKKIEPVPVYFNVADVWGFKADAWYLLLTQEKSPVMLSSGKMGNEGLVLLLIDEEWIWRIVQVGKKTDRKFEIVQWWQHGCERVPAHQLMGSPMVDGARLVWQSHFMPALPWCDKALLDDSYLGMSKANGVFPYLVMIGDDCDFVTADKLTPCKGGQLIYYDDTGKISSVVQCPSCKGSGQKSRLSPLGRLLINPSEVSGDGKSVNVKDSMQWISPEMTTLDFLQKQIDNELAMARALMHIDAPAQQSMNGGEQPTATKSGIDLRNKYAFIQPISDQLFDILDFMLDSIGQMRYGPGFAGVDISRPTSFDMRTEEDWLTELALAYQNDLPIQTIQEVLWGYLKARYGADAATMRAFETIAGADDLFGMPFLQAQYMLAQGLVEKWQMVLHQQSVAIYDRLFRDNKIKGDPIADAEIMIEEAKAATPAEKEGALLSIVKSAIGAPPKTAAA